MALRKLRILGDEILRKKSKAVDKVDQRLVTLIEDMIETMYDKNGVGLAAPQVGVLKKVIVIDVGEGPIVLINPEILEHNGIQQDIEGCLSIPGKSGNVERPNYVKIRAKDPNWETIIVEGEELKARALLHEIDHLEGILFIDMAEDIVDDDEVI